MKKKTSKFAAQVGDDAKARKTQGSKYGHLNLPRGINLFKETSTTLKMDFMLYKVSDPKHPDQKPATGRAMPGELWYKRPYKKHRNVGVNEDGEVCPTSVNKPCPICNFRSKRLKDIAKLPIEQQPVVKEECKALRPSDRNLYVVVPIGHKDYEQKPHIWDISQWAFQEALDEELKEKQHLWVFPDVEEGLTAVIRFKDEPTGGGGAPYPKCSRIDFEARTQAYDESILTEIPNLDDVLIVLPFAELEAKFLEIDETTVKPGAEGQPGDEVVEHVDDTDGGGEEPALAPAPSQRTTPTVRPSARTNPPGRVVTPAAPPDEDEDEQETPAPTPAATPVARSQRTTPVGANKKPATPVQTTVASSTTTKKCPHQHTFGTDFEQFKECEDCELWDSCYDARPPKG